MSNEFDPFIEEWKLYAKSLRHNLIEKCLKLAQMLEFPELDISEYVEKINSMGISLQNLLVEKKNPTYRISILNEYLFSTCGFQGDMDDYYNPKNNFLNNVIDKKTGIPITLSIIYSEVGKFLDLDLKIVGFPSHAIVKYDEETILDPFHHGNLLSLDNLQEILHNSYGDDAQILPEYLDEATTEEILIRMLRNLKNSYMESYAYELAMKCTKIILSYGSDSPDEVRDLGIIEKQMLHYEKAIELLNHYLELDPNANDADFILELIKETREKINCQ